MMLDVESDCEGPVVKSWCAGCKPSECSDCSNEARS